MVSRSTVEADPVVAAIEVWCSSTGRWVTGFTVDEALDAGVTVRRNSDGAILPVVFGWDQIRPVSDSPAYQFT